MSVARSIFSLFSSGTTSEVAANITYNLPILNTSYVMKSTEERKVESIAYKIFSRIILPIFTFLHEVAGRVIMLSTWSSYTAPQYRSLMNILEDEVHISHEFHFQRISVDMDGQHLDGMAVRPRSTSRHPHRWVLFSQSNISCYESALQEGKVYELLKESKSNALFFNYPRVGDSSGPLTKATLIKAHEAMLTYLEDKKKGLGAEEIVLYGSSLGGAVMAESAKNHLWKNDIEYGFITDHTFTSLSDVYWPFGFLIKLFNWNLESTSYFKKCRFPCCHNLQGDDSFINPYASLYLKLKYDHKNVLLNPNFYSPCDSSPTLLSKRKFDFCAQFIDSFVLYANRSV